MWTEDLRVGRVYLPAEDRAGLGARSRRSPMSMRAEPLRAVIGFEIAGAQLLAEGGASDR